MGQVIGGGWGLVVFVGAMVLLAVILWAALNNRQSKRAYRDTEAATRDLYQAEDAKNKADGREV